jgi:predicted transposase YdaD
MDMVGTIMTYQFNTLSREEIDQMLGIKLTETRVYREAQEEKAVEIALNMLKDNLPLEQISRLTGLTIAQLQTPIKQN